MDHSKVLRLHSTFKFFFKKISLSTFSVARVDLFAVTMSPAVKKSLSLGTEVAGIRIHRCIDLPPGKRVGIN